MSKERPSQRPQRPEPTLDPRIEPGSGVIAYEDSVVLPPRRRSGEGPASRGRQPAASAWPTIPPPPEHSPAEESELRRRIARLCGELSEANETVARLHVQVTAERTRNEELQRALDDAEKRAREAQKHMEHAQTESTSAGLKLAELEQNLEDTRAREHGLLGKNTVLEQRVARLEEAHDALKKEHEGAVALLEDSCKEQETEKQRRLRAEASLETERARHAAELERLRLDHAAELVEFRREMDLLRSEREQARGELEKGKDELEQAKAVAADARSALLLEQEMRAKARGAYESAMARTRGELERALKEREEELEQTRTRAAGAFQAQEELAEARKKADEALRAAQQQAEEFAARARKAEDQLREAQERQAALGQQARAALATLADALDRLVGAGEAGDKKG
jgi:chromosome segregation ATPase